VGTLSQSPAQLRTDDELLHWLALRLTPGLGAKRIGDLLRELHTPMAVMRSSPSELVRCGLPHSVAQSVASGCTFDDASAQLERAKREGVQIVVSSDEIYPEQLREIYDPPPLLFARGQIELLREVMIAIVGSRQSSVYGQAVAHKLGLELSTLGAVVVSGMARGIDTYAHAGALKGDFPTVAVFGCGVDVIYPADGGARLSPELPGAESDRERPVECRDRGGGDAIQRVSDHRAAGPRPEP
jgi:DNA processing protein